MEYGSDDDGHRCLGALDGVEDAVAPDPRDPRSAHPASQWLAVLTRVEQQAVHGVHDGMLNVERKVFEELARAS